MPESSTNVEPKGKKDNLKRKSSSSQNEHIEANVEVVNGTVGAKTDLQELTASLKQGFVQMSEVTHRPSQMLNSILATPATSTTDKG